MALPTFTTTFVTPLPALAPGVSITPDINAWVNSAWVPVVVMPYDAALASVTFYAGCTGEFEIDIAVGATPTIIATIHGGNFYIDFSAPDRQLQFDTGTVLLPLPVDLLTSGDTVYARVRSNHSTLTVGPGHPGWTNWRVRIGVLPHPINSTIPHTTAVLKSFFPSTHMAELSVNGPAWVTTGAWVDIGLCTADTVVAGWSHHTWGASLSALQAEWEIDLGAGGAVRATLHSATGSNTGYPRIAMFWNPLDLFTSGETIQARIRRSVGSLSRLDFNLLYYEKPL